MPQTNEISGVQPRARGFTLIELMVVVAVVAILVGIAIPSYSESVRKGRRGQAKSDLVEAAQIAERYRTIQATYDGLAPTATTGPIYSTSPRKGDTFYNIAFAGTPDANTFRLTATPTAGQTGDRCGVLSINQLGEKFHSTGDDSQCQFGTTGP